MKKGGRGRGEREGPTSPEKAMADLKKQFVDQIYKSEITFNLHKTKPLFIMHRLVVLPSKERSSRRRIVSYYNAFSLK